MDHVEEKEFTLRLQVRCAFSDAYDGDADGYEWWSAFPEMAAELTRAARQIAERRGWSVRPSNRGRPSDEEVTLILDRRAL